MVSGKKRASKGEGFGSVKHRMQTLQNVARAPLQLDTFFTQVPLVNRKEASFHSNIRRKTHYGRECPTGFGCKSINNRRLHCPRPSILRKATPGSSRHNTEEENIRQEHRMLPIVAKGVLYSLRVLGIT